MRYDYAELRKLLLPEHKWVYFSIRVLRSNGWVYFFMNMLPVLGTYFVGDQPMTIRSVLGTTFLALASGLVALKAYRSQGANGEEILDLTNNKGGAP